MSPAVNAIVKIMESLPDDLQNQVLEHVREYVLNNPATRFIVATLRNDDLLPDDEDSPEDMAAIEAARADYRAGDYMTLEQYKADREKRLV